MLHVSPEQLTIFGRALSRGRCEAILDFVNLNFGEAIPQVPHEVALDRVRWGLRRADSLGIRQDRAQSLFVCLLFAAGPGFYHHPACRALLADTRFNMDNRVHSLFHAVQDLPWAEIKALGNRTPWDTLQEPTP